MSQNPIPNTAAVKKPKRILIVEDEDAMGRVLESKFRLSGFEARRCTNGEEAVRMLTSEHEDVILMDIMMPGKDGLSVLHDMQTTQNRNTPVFILSNLADDDMVTRAKSLGAKDCFLKARTSLRELVERMQVELA